jgi:hypothetical protein
VYIIKATSHSSTENFIKFQECPKTELEKDRYLYNGNYQNLFLKIVFKYTSIARTVIPFAAKTANMVNLASPAKMQRSY